MTRKKNRPKTQASEPVAKAGDEIKCTNGHVVGLINQDWLNGGDLPQVTFVDGAIDPNKSPAQQRCLECGGQWIKAERPQQPNRLFINGRWV